ncbi:MAG: ABC transporter permease [Thermoproteota archaeon]|jgi:ABC-type multidrug transport system permease subunit
MGNLKSILYKDFKNLYYKKYVIIFSLLYFVFIFYLLINFSSNVNETINLYIINNDEENEYIQDFVNIFKDKNVNLNYEKNVPLNESLEKLFIQRRYDAVLIINKGFTQNLTQFKQPKIEVFVVSESELKRKLSLSYIYQKLDEYFTEFKRSAANNLQNVTNEEYVSYIKFLAKPFILNITEINILQIPYENFAYFSFFIQSSFFSTLIILALLTNSDFTGNYLLLLKRTRFIFLKIFISKILIFSIFFLLITFVYFLISFLYNIVIKDPINLIIIILFVALLSFGLGIVIGCIVPKEYIFLPLTIILTFIFISGGFFLPNFNILEPLISYFPLHIFLKNILNYEILNISYNYNELFSYFIIIIIIMTFSLIIYYLKLKRFFTQNLFK